MASQGKSSGIPRLGALTTSASAGHHRRLRVGRMRSAPLRSSSASGSSPFLRRRSLGRLLGVDVRERVHWYECIETINDYEEAWTIFRDGMTESLFEGLAIPVPYLHDALFYNLNSAVLEQRLSALHNIRMYHPAGPLRRLCAAVTAKTHEQISTARSTMIGPWFSSSYAMNLSAKHNGVVKEIDLAIGSIYRSGNDDIPPREYQVNADTLLAIWGAEDMFERELTKSPITPLEDDVFESMERATTSKPSPGIFQTPRIPPPRRSPAIFVEAASREKLDSIYVIHELIYAESVSITVRIGNSQATYQPSKCLRDKRAFPIGFTLTKYVVKDDGFLEKGQVLRGADFVGAEWNLVNNVPWPAKPPDPILLEGAVGSPAGSKATSSSRQYGKTVGGASTPSSHSSSPASDDFDRPSL